MMFYLQLKTLIRFLVRRDDKKLGENLRSHLVRLFADHSAQVVENDESEHRPATSQAKTPTPPCLV